jgi:hypothetical protein
MTFLRSLGYLTCDQGEVAMPFFSCSHAFTPRIILGTGLVAKRAAEAEATRVAALGGAVRDSDFYHFDGPTTLEALRALTGAATNRFSLGRD